MEQSFFRTMAEEKELIDQHFTIEVDGIHHFMEVEQIIQLIESAPQHEQRQIKDTFSKIDFHNGHLMRYIKFLAEAFIKMQYS